MCATRAEQDNINHPAYGAWTAAFILRKNESRAFLGKYLNDPRVPWRHKRREMMVIAGIIQVAKWLAEIKQRSDIACRLWKRAREQHGASTENLPEETYGHINSAFCNGSHGCPPPHLETSVRQHASCKHQRVSSGLSCLIRRVVWTRCGRRKSLSRYAAENRLRKRQQKLGKNLCERALKGTVWFRPSNVLWKSYLESKARWHND